MTDTSISGAGFEQALTAQPDPGPGEIGEADLPTPQADNTNEQEETEMGFTDDDQITVGADPEVTGDASEDELATGWENNADTETDTE